MSTSFHHLLYGASRTGKTTAAAHIASAGHPLLVVTREPGPAGSALETAGVQAPLVVPKSMDELFAVVNYLDAYLAKHVNGYKPDLILFDNLQGLQGLLVGHPGEPAKEVAGLKVPAIPASGVLRIPKSQREDVTNPEALSQAQYGVLANYTRQLLNSIDQLPVSTIITAGEQYDFDDKYKKDTEGMLPKDKAGRQRKLKGYPAVEGGKTKSFLPHTIAGAFLHLVKEDGKHVIYTAPHVDKDQVEWFAEPRGLRKPIDRRIDWTNLSAHDILVGKRG